MMLDQHSDGTYAVLSLAGPTTGALNLTNATLQVRGTVVNSLTFNALAGNVTLDINNAGNSLFQRLLGQIPQGPFLLISFQ